MAAAAEDDEEVGWYAVGAGGGPGAVEGGEDVDEAELEGRGLVGGLKGGEGGRTKMVGRRMRRVARRKGRAAIVIDGKV